MPMTRIYQYLLSEMNNSVITVWLNRPELHNAFNEPMISEITEVFENFSEMADIRAIVLRGKGKSFCAGADLNWMKRVAGYNEQQNYEDSLALARCFRAIYHCPVPTIAVIHGSAFGGANGLYSACDLAFADIHSVFSFSEVRIGIVPAVISPFVIRRTGEYNARELMITGKRINGPEAERLHLVNRCLPSDELEKYLDETLSQILQCGPVAVKECKTLIDQVQKYSTEEEVMTYTAKLITRLRASEEGREGINAFLEKRQPNWIQPA